MSNNLDRVITQKRTSRSCELRLVRGRAAAIFSPENFIAVLRAQRMDANYYVWYIVGKFSIETFVRNLFPFFFFPFFFSIVQPADKRDLTLAIYLMVCERVKKEAWRTLRWKMVEHESFLRLRFRDDGKLIRLWGC